MFITKSCGYLVWSAQQDRIFKALDNKLVTISVTKNNVTQEITLLILQIDSFLIKIIMTFMKFSPTWHNECPTRILGIMSSDILSLLCLILSF